MDATALYPSMMKQHNISFDTYYGRIVDPLCYKSMMFLKNILGTNTCLPPGFHNELFKLIKTYVDKLEPQNKNDYKQRMYFIMMNCLLKLKKINKPLSMLLDPQTKEDSLILKLYVIPFLDLMTSVHPEFDEISSFSYEYMINNTLPDGLKEMYIYENEYSPKARIIPLDPNKFYDYIKERGLLVTIAGTLFYNHETKMGIISNFIVDRLSMRSKYKKEMYNYEVGSDQYKFFDRRQLSCKVNANSSYGVSGLAGFRFSNHLMAKSITLSGKLVLKISQIVGEMYLNNLRK